MHNSFFGYWTFGIYIIVRTQHAVMYLNILPVLNQNNTLKAHPSPTSNNRFDAFFNITAYSWHAIICSKCAAEVNI